MTPLERAAILRAQSRIAGFQPDTTARLLRAWQIIRDSLDETEIARLLESGAIDKLLADMISEPDLDRAFLSFRQELRSTIVSSFNLSIRDTPKAGKIDGVTAVAFDHLSPKVIDAIRTLESDAINTLKGDVKEVTRAFLENGLRDGKSPTAIARQLRTVIGMAPNQEAAVRNFERMLRAGDREALTRALRNKRFDGTVTKAFAGEGLTEKQIDTMSAAYKRKMIANNANVNATTHTRSAYKLGQQLSWLDAQEKGVVPEGFQAAKTWVHMDPQPNPRPEHQAMDGETVPAGQNYSNGDSYAGEGDPFNCHCLDRYSVRRIA